MQRFQFRLERVLHLKQQREKLGELRVQKARLTVEEARRRVRLLEEELATIAGDLHGGRVAAAEWPAAFAHSAVLGKKITAAAAEVAQAERLLQEAMAEHVRLSQEVETLLHLRRSAWQAHKDEAALVEQQSMDEMSMRRWQASSAGAFALPRPPEGDEE